MLIRNILLAFTTSCVSIFDISNDILFSSLSFCYLYMTKKTSDLPLNAKKHPYFRFESRGVFAPVSVFSLTVSSLFYRQQSFEPLCLLSIGKQRRSDTTAFVRTIPETFKGLGLSQQTAFWGQKALLVQMK